MNFSEDERSLKEAQNYLFSGISGIFLYDINVKFSTVFTLFKTDSLKNKNAAHPAMSGVRLQKVFFT